MLKNIDLFITNALTEDIGIGDITSLATINKEPIDWHLIHY